jgi:hypothetical protein
MRKLMLWLISFAVAVSAGPAVNFTGYADTLNIYGFRSDSLKFTAAVVNQGNWKKLLQVTCDDTDNAGHRDDSIKFYYGIQLGNIFRNLAGSVDTLWSNGIILDTLNALISNVAQFYHPEKMTGATQWGIGATTGAVSYTFGQVDTGTNSNSVNQWHPLLEPAIPWAPLYRFYAKGLITGNNKQSYLKLRFTLSQQLYINMKQY